MKGHVNVIAGCEVNIVYYAINLYCTLMKYFNTMYYVQCCFYRKESIVNAGRETFGRDGLKVRKR